ncbi:serine hydroxymethyltransferase, partial [Buchnera aphidicola (Hormaphis cornu)]
IRIGTPAVTRRGFKENEVKTIAYWIIEILNDIDNHKKIINIKKQVLDICQRYPIYLK